MLENQFAGPDQRQLETLEAASPEHVTLIRAPGGSTLSSSQRMIAGGGIGLLGGLVLLIVMELLGARIRDVAGTEGAARMPVIAEIPVVKMNRADRFVVATAADPASLTAEAYRSLRTSLLAMWQRHPKNVALDPAARMPAPPTQSIGAGRPLRSLLVTSPGPAEGKSITVVNLAAAFAETGMTVIIIDADFRRPTQYRYLDRPRSPNLGDLDITCTPADLDAVLQDTEVPGVRLAASAPNKADPGHSIAVAKAAARVGQEIADIVLIDSPPLLLANDASDIALSVDASILLARSGWTRRSGIAASADLHASARGPGDRHRHRRRRARRPGGLLRLLRLLRLRVRLRPPGRGLDHVEAAAVEGRPPGGRLAGPSVRRVPVSGATRPGAERPAGGLDGR